MNTPSEQFLWCHMSFAIKKNIDQNLVKILPYDAHCTKRAVMQFADKAGPDQPAHSCRLIWALVVCLQNQWIQ